MDSKIDLDEILSILEEEQNSSSAKKEPKEYKRKENATVKRFIRKVGITAGNTRVPNYLIFHQYRQFMRTSTPNDAVGKTEFFRNFNRYFDQVRTGKQRYYKLNDALKMDENAHKLAKTYEETLRGRLVTKKKKN